MQSQSDSTIRNVDATAERRLLSWKQLQVIVPKSAATIWRWERAGAFPCRIKIGKNSVAWDSLAVQKWLAEKLSA